MNKDQLLDSFSCLDDEIIERSEQRVKRPSWHKWVGAAACLALVAGAAVLSYGILKDRNAAQKQSTASGGSDTAVADPGTGKVQSAAQFAAGYEPAPGESDVVLGKVPDEVLQSTVDAAQQSGSTAMGPMLPADSYPVTDPFELTPMIESFKVEYNYARYPAPKNGEIIYSMPLRGALIDHGDSARYRVMVGLFRDENALAPEGPEAEAERERLSALGVIVAYETYFDGTENHYYFTLHATCEQLTNFNADERYGYLLSLYGEFVGSGQGDPSVVFNPSVSSAAASPVNSSGVLTLAEALSDPEFGGYMCKTPAGFAEEGFRRTEDKLFGSFSRGYDYLDWSVAHFTEEDKDRLITSIDETEKYDVSLYTIPYANSVPEKYSSVFSRPIFSIFDLTLDVVKARTNDQGEAGDDGGPRISFCVLCGDILIEVKSKGIEPEDMYKMFSFLDWVKLPKN